MSLVTISEETIDKITDADVFGTPISHEDLEGFRQAIRFSRVPQSYWEKFLPDVEVIWHYATLERGKEVRIDYQAIDHAEGKYFRQILSVPYPQALNNSSIGAELVETLFSYDYPFTEEYITERLFSFRYEYTYDSFCPIDLWESVKNRLSTIVLPTALRFSLEVRREIVRKANLSRFNDKDTEWARRIILPEDFE